MMIMRNMLCGILFCWLTTTMTANAFVARLPQPPRLCLQQSIGSSKTTSMIHSSSWSSSTSSSLSSSISPADTQQQQQPEQQQQQQNEAQLRILKSNLIRKCQESTASVSDVRVLVDALLRFADQDLNGYGQASSESSTLLSGEWELLYASTDKTRSSPFFWAFRKAVGDDSAGQIYDITDAIPSPLKEIGPAFQVIDWNAATQTGNFVSRVKVATLGGAATSIMTTRASLIGADGRDGIKIQVETTKPEKSTVLSTLLGPLGDVLNENAPAFPSGAALEQMRAGSSVVIMRTPYCDEGLRISMDDARPDDFFVWRRRQFADYDFL